MSVSAEAIRDRLEKALVANNLEVVDASCLAALKTLASAFVESGGNETVHGQVFGDEEYQELLENSGLNEE